MNHYVGLDVSLKTVFICIINEKGKIIKEPLLNLSCSQFQKKSNFKLPFIWHKE